MLFISAHLKLSPNLLPRVLLGEGREATEWVGVPNGINNNTRQRRERQAGRLSKILLSLPGLHKRL